jgi:hypothetical protein
VGVGATNAIVVNNTGYVGIGTTAPATALDVVGNVRCTAGIDLNYTTFPTYASNQIGYTIIINPSSTVNTTNGIVIVGYTLPSAGTYSLNGYATSSTNTVQAIGYIIISLSTKTGTLVTSGTVLSLQSTLLTNTYYYANIGATLNNTVSGIYSGSATNVYFNIDFSSIGATTLTTSSYLSITRIG